jgi:hypothetical protein
MSRWSSDRILPLVFALPLMLVLAAFAWRCVTPFLHSEPEQDACEFGSVSNARYRELLSEARKRDGTTWPKLRDYRWQPPLEGVRELATGIKERVQDLTKGMTSLYEKLAAMHAVARSLGAFHRVTEVDFARYRLDKPFGVLPYGYDIDVIMLGSSEPFMGKARLIFRLGISNHPGHDDSPGKFGVGLLWPRWFERNPSFAGWPVQACPPMPPPEWAAAFEAWSAKLP